MKLSRKASVVAATFLLAAATGQYMQSTAGHGPRKAAPAPAQAVRTASIALPTQITPLAAPAETSDSALRGAIPNLPTLSPVLPAALTAPKLAPPAPAADTGSGGTTASAACHAGASVTVDEGAILDFKLDAPCHAGERVVIRHAGLAFTELTDAKGGLEIRLPAMAEDASVSAKFAGGTSVTATTSVPELSLYDRVAVQWVGKDSFALHALEFGARFGEDGDISAANPGSAAPTTEATEGFLTRLGDTKVNLPMRAEIYTYPTRLSAQEGKVKIVIEAGVTPETCGREMLAETLRSRRNAAPRVTELSVAMPACDAKGGFVELTGLVPDIEVASE